MKRQTKRQRDAQEREYAAMTDLLEQEERQAEQDMDAAEEYAAWDRRTCGGFFQDSYHD